MCNESRAEYLTAIRSRYHACSRKEQTAILDEFCSVCQYHRKYAIRLLNQKPRPTKSAADSNPGPKKRYDDPELLEVIFELWQLTNLPCSKRLKAIIHLWLPHYRGIVSDKIKRLLMQISPATIDRLMASSRIKYCKRGLTTTKPGSIIKKRIPIKTNQWDETIPGFLEADTVAHCGNSVAGMFVYTLNCVDLATGWTEQRAVWGKGEKGVTKAIKCIESSLPFPIRGFDCDNGSEFLNWHLLRFMTDRTQPIQFTRARPYHSNDNAHIENKNWTHIRQLLGYERFDQPQIVDQLNELFTSEWRLYLNFFIPSVKLVEKERLGSKVTKRHDQPKTPAQRVLESKQIPETTKKLIRQQRESIDPFNIQKRMSKKISAIVKQATKPQLTSIQKDQ